MEQMNLEIKREILNNLYNEISHLINHKLSPIYGDTPKVLGEVHLAVEMQHLAGYLKALREATSRKERI